MTSNRAPIARHTGPYTGTVGAPVLLDARPSSDPDNDPVVKSHWILRRANGTTVLDVTTSDLVAAVVWHTAEVLTVRLTVTDSRGATSTTVLTSLTITRPPVFDHLDLTGPTAIRVNEVGTFTATAVYSDGSTVDVTASAVWQSSDPHLAVVVGGTVSGRAEGTVSITASVPMGSKTASLLVMPPTVIGDPAPTLSLTSSPASVLVGGSVTLSWTSANATSVTASGAWSGSKALVGSESQTPPSVGSYDYILTAIGPGGQTVKSVTVTVSSVGGTLATYDFPAAGWATFGLALPSGAAPAHVQVGNLPTQTDIKTQWGGGSIRFAIVTANIPSPGTYAITAHSAVGGSLTPTWPSASVSFVIAGTTYTATLPAFTGADSWLTGALVREARVVVVPTASGTPHPLLQVLFDVRSYTGGGHRVDVTVQNVRDIADMDKVTYDLTVSVAGTTVLTRNAFTQYAYTRWRKAFTTGLTEATILPDFEPFYVAAALPRYMPSIANLTYNTSTAAWDINGFCELNPEMGAGGYRPELSPFPEFQAQYLVHKSASLRSATMLSGNNSGSWTMHLAKADGVSLIKVTEVGSEGYWFDYYKRGGDYPKAPLRPDGVFRGARMDPQNGYSDVESSADPEHVPNLTYLPYLVTGDRYYLDQTKFWAAWAVLTFPAREPVIPEPIFEPDFNRSRGLSLGRVWVRGLTRELGHPLEILAMAAAAAPDSDADKGYFTTVVQNQLDGLAAYVTTTGLAGGIAEAMGWEEWKTQDSGYLPGRYFSLWRLSYTAYAIDFAAQQGLWTMGNALEFAKRAVRSQIGFITNGDTGGEKVPGYPTIALTSNNDQVIAFYADWPTLFSSNRANFPGAFGPTPVGYHGVEAQVLLVVGKHLGVAGVDAAEQWLMSYQDAYGSISGDLDLRSGYALLYP